jgi:hypothetical protein
MRSVVGTQFMHAPLVFVHEAAVLEDYGNPAAMGKISIHRFRPDGCNKYMKF